MVNLLCLYSVAGEASSSLIVVSEILTYRDTGVSDHNLVKYYINSNILTGKIKLRQEEDMMQVLEEDVPSCWGEFSYQQVYQTEWSFNLSQTVLPGKVSHISTNNLLGQISFHITNSKCNWDINLTYTSCSSSDLTQYCNTSSSESVKFEKRSDGADKRAGQF